MTNNPFSITKAVDYTDRELYDFWVDFPNVGFNETIKPTLEMPMIILGSKGSGKTHIMKHFSFTMQSLRHSENLLQGIIEDGYIGTYLRCSGLNGYKFSGRGEDEKTWETYFSYYLELWLGQLLLNNICKLFDKNKPYFNEYDLVEDIINLFDKPSKLTIETLGDFRKYLNSLQKEIDYAINNRALTRISISESVEVLLSPGALIFGIPKILSKKVKEFNDLKFLYLLDEYENFTENQQKYFNTLIRERENPTCFKIGARRYGIRTTSTLSANEYIKKGSEYDQIDIDEIFRKNNKNYNQFIKSICINRFKYYQINLTEEQFENYFESFNEEKFIALIKKRGRKHLDKLKSDLNNYGLSDISGEIISNLKFSKNIILERVNILLLYRAWKKGNDLSIASKTIKNNCLKYSKSQEGTSEHGKILNKHKTDLIAALSRENNLKLESYIGLNNLIKISNGIPRHFLITMKHIYRWNDFFEKNNFTNNEQVNSTIQLNAIKDTANWFIEDAKVNNYDDNKIRDSIERLCDYLRELRFSNLPPESSISTFSIDSKVVPKEITSIVNYLEQYSYLIKVESGRRDKNFNSRNHTFQINGLLAMIWELSLSRRGIVQFSFTELKAIFSPDDDNEYKKMRNNTLLKYNAPFNTNPHNLSLFGY